MDKRIAYKIVIDTETCPINSDGPVMGDNALCYDIGYAIVDKRGKVYKTRSFINGDIFLGQLARMRTAYYFDKVPMYYEGIKEGSRILTDLLTIRDTLIEDIQEYNVKEVYAHNMLFDFKALNKTIEWVTYGAEKEFFPQGVAICDTLKMARDVISKTPTYKAYCETNGYMTKHKVPRTKLTAEVLYRFISNNDEFVESHTGLEDVLIEKEIMAYCYRKHKKMRKLLKE